MDTRAKRAAEKRAQLHAAAAERVKARQKLLDEEQTYIPLLNALAFRPRYPDVFNLCREREARLAEEHFNMLDERK